MFWLLALHYDTVWMAVYLLSASCIEDPLKQTDLGAGWLHSGLKKSDLPSLSLNVFFSNVLRIIYGR